MPSDIVAGTADDCRPPVRRQGNRPAKQVLRLTVTGREGSTALGPVAAVPDEHLSPTLIGVRADVVIPTTDNCGSTIGRQGGSRSTLSCDWLSLGVRAPPSSSSRVTVNVYAVVTDWPSDWLAWADATEKTALSDALFSTWNVVEPSAGVFAGDRNFWFPASSAMRSALDSPGSRFSVGRQLYCRLKGSIQLITRHRVLNIEDPPHMLTARTAKEDLHRSPSNAIGEAAYVVRKMRRDDQ